MRILFRDSLEKDDLLILLSESDKEAKLLMNLGAMTPTIVGRTSQSDHPNYERSQAGKIIEQGFQAQLQILFRKTPG